MRCLLSSYNNGWLRSLTILVLVVATWPALAADTPAPCVVDHVDTSAPATTDKARTLARTIESADPCTVVPGIKVKSLRALWANLVNGSRVGGKRFEAPLPAGLPSGTVIAGPVHFDFSAVAGEHPSRFVLTAGTQTIVDSAPPPSNYTFDHPNPNTTYSWVLVTSRQSYKAKFDILPEDESRAVAEKLATIGKAVADPLTRAFYAAAIYDDAGLYSQRDAALASVRTGITP